MPVPLTVARPGPKRTMRDEVYEQLLRPIYTGGLAPGSRLVDADIERSTGASRTPIREAIAMLVEVGFVQVSPQSVTRVSPLDVAWLRGCVQLLGWTFCEIVTDVTDNLSEEDITELEQGFGAAQNAASWRDILTAPGLGRDSFGVLIRKKANASYANFEGHYSPHIGRALNLYPELLPLRDSAAHVGAFLTAVNARDAAQASEAMRDMFAQMDIFLDRLEAQLTSEASA